MNTKTLPHSKDIWHTESFKKKSTNWRYCVLSAWVL